ncbi:MAG: hypothetical protein HRU38_05080 [Saccharospirillaceae bacterium]|nr:hypothetical protein [Pseudomonadales bacterium]NRB78030.1 hypothetical protein [Saccharospirillaceae bacterium]
MKFIRPQSIQLLTIIFILMITMMVVQKNHAKGLSEKQIQAVIKNPQVTINNIDIKGIDQNLLVIYPLTCDIWSGFEFEECLELEGNQVFFSVEGDYNYDGFDEQYHTGYAQFESGKWVKYLLVLDHQLEVLMFKVIELDGLTDYYNFTGIFINNNQLYWVECISCDVIYAIRMFDAKKQKTLAYTD